MMKKNGTVSAFTLVELLISSTIFAIVMLTLYSAFHTGIFGYRNIEEAIDINQKARLILERINLDLRNSFVYSKDETRFTGDKNEINFLALVDTYSQDKVLEDYAFISYKLERNKLLRLCRKNKEALNDKSEEEFREMASDIEDIIFNYGYVEARGEQMFWKDLWDDPKKIPVAIKVRLTLRDRLPQEFERTIFFPVTR